VVTHERLMLHMAAMSSRLPSHAASVAVSWLPLYHDMGLVGGLLFPFYNGFPGHMIATGDFQRQPAVWLDAMSRFRGTITAAPPSAYAVCTQLAPRLAAGGLDLSAWECAMVGAEPISAQVLRRFAAAFAPAGFRAEAFFPVYGLAEATVAVTFPDLLAPARIDRIDRRALERDGRAVPAADEDGAIELVAVGRAIPRTEIRIVREDGEIAAARTVGEIQVRSDTLMAGYYGDPGATADAVSGGWLRTGDLGYEAAGLLFVTGRQKEIIIRGGQNLVPAVLEEIASSVEGVRPGGVAAVGVRSESRQSELVCVVAETKLEEPRHREIAAQIRSALRARGVSPDRVVLVPPRSLPRTTSGKIRRLELARRLAAEATPP
jgi:acyl-CoA synthetase (AMP-forming)/AMP-acid ligase II